MHSVPGRRGDGSWRYVDLSVIADADSNLSQVVTASRAPGHELHADQSGHRSRRGVAEGAIIGLDPSFLVDHFDGAGVAAFFRDFVNSTGDGSRSKWVSGRDSPRVVPKEPPRRMHYNGNIEDHFLSNLEKVTKAAFGCHRTRIQMFLGAGDGQTDTVNLGRHVDIPYSTDPTSSGGTRIVLTVTVRLSADFATRFRAAVLEREQLYGGRGGAGAISLGAAHDIAARKRAAVMAAATVPV